MIVDTSNFFFHYICRELSNYMCLKSIYTQYIQMPVAPPSNEQMT